MTRKSIINQPLLNDKSITIKISKFQFKKLKEICNQDGISVSYCIRYLITEYLEDRLIFVNK